MKNKTSNPLLDKPVFASDLVSGLKRVGLTSGQNVLVHTSLSQIGWVMGGSETLIRALFEVIGPQGTLMMPGQTWKNLDPSTGVHWDVPASWWQDIRDHWPAFDPAITPVIGMGVTAEMFRTWPGTQRSDHPARSFCACGPQASFLVEKHDLSNIFGLDSPLDRLYQIDGQILLLGVGHNKNTSLHLAETRAHWPGKHEVEESSAIKRNGKREWVTYPTLAVDDGDFESLGKDWEGDRNYQPQKIGNAEVRLISQRDMVDYAVKWMEKHR